MRWRASGSLPANAGLTTSASKCTPSGPCTSTFASGMPCWIRLCTVELSIFCVSSGDRRTGGGAPRATLGPHDPSCSRPAGPIPAGKQLQWRRRMVLKILGQRRKPDVFHAYAALHLATMNAPMLAAARPLSNPLLDATALVRSAQAVIATEAQAIEALHGRIDANFLRACQLMFECNGRVVVSGMG